MIYIFPYQEDALDKYIEIHFSAGSIDEARHICRYLVQERLVACAQIIPWIESLYVWNNQLETTQESKAVLKTTIEHFEHIKEAIIANSTYQVPEITYSSIDGGSKEYLEWIAQSTPTFSTADVAENKLKHHESILKCE